MNSTVCIKFPAHSRNLSYQNKASIIAFKVSMDAIRHQNSVSKSKHPALNCSHVLQTVNNKEYNNTTLNTLTNLIFQRTEK